MKIIDTVILLSIGFFSHYSQGKCIHFDLDYNTPNLDGPGSWGPLHDTLTLDCLRYVEMQKEDDQLIALIEDDRGNVHQVRVGDFMGENTGRVVRIEKNAVHLVQIIKDSKNRWVQIPKSLFFEH